MFKVIKKVYKNLRNFGMLLVVGIDGVVVAGVVVVVDVIVVSFVVVVVVVVLGVVVVVVVVVVVDVVVFVVVVVVVDVVVVVGTGHLSSIEPNLHMRFLTGTVRIKIKILIYHCIKTFCMTIIRFCLRIETASTIVLSKLFSLPGLNLNLVNQRET